MTNDYSKMADDIFGAESGAKLAGKKSELSKLINTPDGKSVKKMLESDGMNLKQAVQTGDVASLKETLSDILKTEEGARLAEQIMKMMK